MSVCRFFHLDTTQSKRLCCSLNENKCVHVLDISTSSINSPLSTDTSVMVLDPGQMYFIFSHDLVPVYSNSVQQ